MRYYIMYSNRMVLALRFAIASCFAFFVTLAGAATFGLSPMRVDLSGEVSTAVLTVTNGGDQPLTVQVQARAWGQKDDQEQLSQSTDFILNPALVTIAPGEEQIVRIALRTPPDRIQERAYRLIVREVPQVESATTGFRMALAMDIPVYVAPLAANAAASPTFSIDRESGVARIKIANGGTRHLRLADLRVSQGERQLLEQSVFVVLPGVVRHLRLTGNASPSGEPLRLRAQSNVGPIDTTLKLVAGH